MTTRRRPAAGARAAPKRTRASSDRDQAVQKKRRVAGDRGLDLAASQENQQRENLASLEAPCEDAQCQQAQTSSLGRVICRDSEVSKLRDVVKSSLLRLQGTSVYVPGQPGTGKTHTVTAVLRAMDCANWGVEEPAVALINCMDRPSTSLGRLALAGLYDAARLLKANQGGTPLCCSILPRSLM